MSWDTTVIADGATSHWKFEDADATTFLDSLGAASGTYQNSSTTVCYYRQPAGLFQGLGHSYCFRNARWTGANTNSGTLTFGGKWSLEGWFTFYDLAGSTPRGIWEHGSGEGPLMVRVSDASKRPGQIDAKLNSVAFADPGAGTDIAEGDLVHLALVVDAPSAVAKLYKNGVEIGSQTISTGLSIASSTLKTLTNGGGRQPNALALGQAYYQGVALSPAQVAAHAGTVTLPGSGAPASVVEIATGTIGSSAAPTVTIATTPQTGDIVVVAYPHTTFAYGVNSISGLGATWTVVKSLNSDLWGLWAIGVGATTAGVVTASFGSARTGMTRAFVLRGVNGGLASFGATDGNPVTALPGLAHHAGAGQVVLAYTNSDIALSSYPSTPSKPSAAGWTAQTAQVMDGATKTANTAYALPTTTQLYRADVALGTSSSVLTSQIVVGSPPVAAAGGSGVFTVGMKLFGTVYAPGAALPAMSASVKRSLLRRGLITPAASMKTRRALKANGTSYSAGADWPAGAAPAVLRRMLRGRLLVGAATAPVTPTVTVVEVAAGVAASTATPTATLTTTPQPGDVLIAVLNGGQNSSTFVSAAGCGASWSSIYAPAGTTSGQRMFIAGTGATAAGTVTLTVSAARNCFLTLLLVRGLTSTTTAGQSVGTASAAALIATSQTAAPGQIAIAAVRNNDSTAGRLVLPASGSLPSSGLWTPGTAQTNSFLGTAAVAYAIPAASGSYAVQAGISTGTASFDISQIVLGTPF